MDMIKATENELRDNQVGTVENGGPGIQKIPDSAESMLKDASAVEGMDMSDSNGNKRKLEQSDNSPPMKKSAPSDPDETISTEKDEITPLKRNLVQSTPDNEAKQNGDSSASKSRETESSQRVPSRGSDKECAPEIVSKYVKLTQIPRKVPSLPPLKPSERKELETCLEIGKEDSWRDDWIGNLAFADKDVVNPDGKGREKSKKSLFRWAERGKTSLKILNNLLRYVFNLKETPPQAKKILANADPRSVASIQNAVRRVSYDPLVLREDGWTTAKSSDPVGASGGPHRIGEMVFWQGYEGVIIAYIHDHDLGDLWKAMWLEEFDTFDLEAEELDDARRKYCRKQKTLGVQEGTMSTKNSSSQSASSVTSKGSNAETTRRSGRYPSADFSVHGIEHGIVLAVSYSRGSRPGVFWPARVMHFSESKSFGSQTKRGSQKQKVDVVFLAPYWNSPPVITGSRRSESYSESISRLGSSIFSAGSLFEVETIDASEETIQEYPQSSDDHLDIDQLRVSFKFAGLPKAAFSRFLNSHRLAMALRNFSKRVLKSTAITDLERTTAGLLEAHPLAAQTTMFPPAVLHLPFDHILSQLPALDRESSDMSFDESSTNVEPTLQLGAILDSMKPPLCFGMPGKATSPEATPRDAAVRSAQLTSPPLTLSFDETSNSPHVTIERFISDLPSLNTLLSNPEDESTIGSLLSKSLNQLLKKIPHNTPEYQSLPTEMKRNRSQVLVKLWIVVKTHGEELISSSHTAEATPCLVEWRRACERMYKYITLSSSSPGFGNGVSQILTDSLCNLHVTSNECFERAVRLPAALKAARDAGAGKSDNIQLISSVMEKYIEIAEKQVIKRAHSKTYLRRIKKKCLAVANQSEVVALTEDSDGNGGEDTKGSKGSWKAAVVGVGAAIQAVDMIMNGVCVNAFCLTRPPGHHAGRELHPMKAVSNGFCLLNSVACAALYATSPVSEGGPGLRRVCVIDIDVHHGNGTQDILASTYDPRFFYVSVHAGGPDVNGVDPAEGEDQPSHHLGRTPKKGIFPGRCGDYSPHEGVLNIPLGARVTSHALGTALVQKVTPAVEKFAPELIIVSAGFDAHKNDPLGLGGLAAEDYGTLTEVICKLAHKSCSGRVLSVLEGGYGVPCCRPMTNLFDPEAAKEKAASEAPTNEGTVQPASGNGGEKESSVVVPKQEQAPNDLQILDLGDDLPEDMEDNLSYLLRKRMDKCHAEGFIDCVRDHIKTLAKCNKRS